MQKPTHFDDAGRARMVDVSAKAETRRTARRMRGSTPANLASAENLLESRSATQSA